MAEIHIWPEGVFKEGDNAIVKVRVEIPDATPQNLWYRIPGEHKSALTESCDPFAVGLIFRGMLTSSDLVIHGQVSPSLLRNLVEFQNAWSAWRPERYSQVDIRAEIEKEEQRSEFNEALTAFSGGVDSNYSAVYHRIVNKNRKPYVLRAGLMVLGFNMGLDKVEEFEHAVRSGREILNSLEMELIPIASNLKWISREWFDAFGAILASCLSLLGGRFSSGLIPSDRSYPGLVLPWGSNPLTDPLLSSDSFRIIHDGARLTRFEKIGEIGNIPEVRQHLRVCFYPTKDKLNCGRCEKCVRTILGFRALGLGLPECFKREAGFRDFFGFKFKFPPLQMENYRGTYEAARKRYGWKPWVIGLQISMIVTSVWVKLRRITWLRRLKHRIFPPS